MTDEEAYTLTPEQEHDYFEQRYSVAYVLLDERSGKLQIGDPALRVCRYCKKSAPDTTFKKEAHTIPIMTGNRWLTSLDECDRCNAIFSVHEDHFGKYVLPFRALNGVRGRNGLPVLATAAGRIEATDTGINIAHSPGSPIIVSDDENKKLTLTVTRHAHVPQGVHKCLVKMALALMPPEVLPKYEYLVPWILDPEYRAGQRPYSPLLMLEQLANARPRGAGIRVLLFIRNPEINDCPSCYFVLLFSNIQFQIILPSAIEDAHFANGGYPPMVWFPVPNTPDQRFGPSIRRVRDLTSHEVIRDNTVEFVFTYGEKVPNVAPSLP